MIGALETFLDIFPIRTRVRLRASGELGTVTAWWFAGGMSYLVATDSGGRAICTADALERSVPHAHWFLEATVLENLAIAPRLRPTPAVQP